MSQPQETLVQMLPVDRQALWECGFISSTDVHETVLQIRQMPAGVMTFSTEVIMPLPCFWELHVFLLFCFLFLPALPHFEHHKTPLASPLAVCLSKSDVNVCSGLYGDDTIKDVTHLSVTLGLTIKSSLSCSNSESSVLVTQRATSPWNVLRRINTRPVFNNVNTHVDSPDSYEKCLSLLLLSLLLLLLSLIYYYFCLSDLRVPDD